MNMLLKYIFIGCLFFSCSRKQSIKYLTDLEQANIKGRVAKLVTESYNVDSLGQVNELESATIEMYDKLGYTSTDTAKYFIKKNEVVNFLVYNKDGSLSSLSTFQNGKKQSRMLLKYEESKCITIEIYDSNDKLESYYSHILQNDFGLLSSLNSYDTNGKLKMSYANVYDSIYQIRATSKDNVGILKSEFTIQLTDKKYQKNRFEITYLKDSTIKNYLSYKYEGWDATGNWLMQTVYNDKGKATKFVKRIFSYEY